METETARMLAWANRVVVESARLCRDLRASRLQLAATAAEMRAHRVASSLSRRAEYLTRRADGWAGPFRP